nr:hypothetical protein [Clostridia bacterium]
TVPMSYITSSVQPEKCADISLRPVTEADVPFLASLHEKYASKYDGVFARSASPKYWIDWMSRNPGYRLMAEKGGKTAAYADFEAKDGRLIFREYLGDGEFAAELFGHIAAEYIGNSASDAAAAEAAVKLTDIPAPVAEALGFSAAALSERRDFMYRLNTPFTLGGIEIDTPSKLRALLNNAATFKADAY